MLTQIIAPFIIESCLQIFNLRIPPKDHVFNSVIDTTGILVCVINLYYFILYM